MKLVTNLAHRLSSSCVSGRAVVLRPKYVCIVCAYLYPEPGLSVCLQLQNELSQKMEKLHMEVSLKHQLSEEHEQVSAAGSLFFFFFCSRHHRATPNCS